MDKPYEKALQVDPDDPALAVLTERQRSVLLRRRTMTLAQIAAQEGVTPARIRQIEQVALWKLRGPRARRLRNTS